MSAQQQVDEHPLAPLGYRRPPFWLWRRSQRLYVIAASFMDIWLIVTGRCSLHRAWQSGYTYGSMKEYERIVINGGDLGPILQEVVDVTHGWVWEDDSVPSTNVSNKIIAKAWERIRARRLTSPLSTEAKP